MGRVAAQVHQTLPARWHSHSSGYSRITTSILRSGEPVNPREKKEPYGFPKNRKTVELAGLLSASLRIVMVKDKGADEV